MRDAHRSKRRNILTVVSNFFRRLQSQKVDAGAAERPDIDQLRQEITVLKNRCAILEGYGSCRPSTLDIPQGLRKHDAEMSQSIVTLSEDSESKSATTGAVAQVWARLATQYPIVDNVEHSIQANATLLETNDQAVPAGGNAEAKDVDLVVQPAIPSRAAKDGRTSPPVDQNPSGVTPITRGATAAVRADSEDGLSETGKALGVHFSQTDQHKLPRKKEEDEELGAEVMAELEAQSGCIDQQRLPRKKLGNEELEVETPPPPVRQERMPRKKESEESDGGCSG